MVSSRLLLGFILCRGEPKGSETNPRGFRFYFVCPFFDTMWAQLPIPKDADVFSAPDGEKQN